MIKMIILSTLNLAASYQNRLPWQNPDYIKQVLNKTKGDTILMGRKTYEALPPDVTPVTNRYTYVVSTNKDYQRKHPEINVIHNPHSFLKHYSNNRDLWIVGGPKLFKQTIQYANEIHYTKILMTATGDIYFHIDDYLDKFKLIDAHMYRNDKIKQIPYITEIYQRNN